MSDNATFKTIWAQVVLFALLAILLTGLRISSGPMIPYGIQL